MDLDISKILSDYLDGKIKNSDFETWVYSDKSLESFLGADIYNELISLTFEDKSIKIKVQELVDSKIDYQHLHKQEIIELIDNTISRKLPLQKSLTSFYDWAMSGYYFLGRINVIGNFGEQGKSIVHIIDDSMTENEQLAKLLKEEPDFLTDIKLIKTKLMTGEITLTGEKEANKYLGTQFKFREK